MIVYIDSEYRCHAGSGDGYRAVNVPALDGKCATYINGYRFIPDGESWTDEEGYEWTGESLSPIVNYDLLLAAQAQYEEDMATVSDMQEALEILGVTE